jgi:hypothetical protein
LISAFIRELSVQLWIDNQWTKEAKEMIDSYIRTKPDTVEEKTLVVQEGMERVVDNH